MRVLDSVMRSERNKNLYLLLAILFHNFIYPFSVGQGPRPVFFYFVFGSMFVFGVLLLSKRRTERVLTAVLGLMVFVFGLLNAYDLNTWALPLLYVSAIGYHVMIIIVLVRYIFLAKRVLAEVILAATSLYLVFGSIYTAIYGFIEWAAPGSFAVSSGAELGWQQFLYYSYVTLTTLGYGDITPVGFYAQSAAMFQATLGVLYTVILLSRLVSLYEPPEGQRT